MTVMSREEAEKLSGFVHELVAKLERQDDDAQDFLRAMLDWVAREFSKSTKAHFRNGNKTALMYALYVSLSNGLLPPEWARQEITQSAFGHPKSWDDVFGPPPKYRIPEMARAFALGTKLHAEGYKKDDNSLFPALAERLSTVVGKRISAGKAKALYYGFPASDLLLLRLNVEAGTLDAAVKQQLTFIIDVLSCLGVGTSKKGGGKFGRENNQA
jgi:hypothetical protein